MAYSLSFSANLSTLFADAPLTDRYALRTSASALEVMRRVDRPNVKFQHDAFHTERMEGNLTETVTKNLPLIGHVQIADLPRWAG